MAWQSTRSYKKSGGLNAVSSAVGAEIYTKTCLHDDGVKGYGGMRVACIGPMRQGKTTLGLTTIIKLMYITHIEKEKWLCDCEVGKLNLETIVYRGRKLDYWNCFTKKTLQQVFPGCTRPGSPRVCMARRFHSIL